MEQLVSYATSCVPSLMLADSLIAFLVCSARYGLSPLALIGRPGEETKSDDDFAFRLVYETTEAPLDCSAVKHSFYKSTLFTV